MDREKVVNTLEEIKTQTAEIGLDSAVIAHKFIDKIIALLKEQETTSTAESRLFHCEKCGYGIDDIYLSNEHDFDVCPHYCPNCGRKVKWND